MEVIVFGIPVLAILPYFFNFLFRSRRLIKVADFMIFLYFFFLFSGFIYAIFHPSGYKYPPSIVAMLFLVVCLCVYMAPIIFFQKRSSAFLDLCNKKIFIFLCIFFSLGSFSSIIYFSYKAYDVFVYGVGQYRLDLNQGMVSPLESSVFNSFNVLFSTMFGVTQLLGLIVLSTSLFGRFSKHFGLFMLFLSVSYVLNSLAFAGRDGVVFWIISLCFNVVLVRSLFSVNGLEFIFKWLFFLGVGMLVPFLVISYARFGDGMLYSIFYYVSHQLVTFNDYFSANLPIYYGDSGFSEIKKYLGLDVYLERGSLSYEYMQRGVIPWVWAYFIGSLLLDFGRLGTLCFLVLMSIFMFIVILKKTRRSAANKIIPLDALLVFFLYCQIGFMGVFYFKHAVMNNYVIALLLMSFLLYIVRVFFGGFVVKPKL